MPDGESKRSTSSIKEGTLLVIEKEKTASLQSGQRRERFSRKMIGPIRKVKYLGDSK